MSAPAKQQGTVRPEPRADVREALHELQQYFSDQLAPMMVSHSVEVLLTLPPQIMLTAIQGWIGAQFRRQAAEASVSDYLFHAATKLHQMIEYDLIDKARMSTYLEQLNQLLVGACPEGERALLQESLSRIGVVTDGGPVAPVQSLHRQAGAGGAVAGGGGAAAGSATAQMTPDIARGMKRLSLLLERLGRGADGSSTGGELQSEILATAASHARSGEELTAFLDRLRGVGVDAQIGQVFRALGRGIPGWDLPVAAVAAAENAAHPLASHHSVQAMHRIIAMSQSAEEGAHRFNEMIQTAVEQFNDGSLARAAAMIDLAERIVEEKQLDGDVVSGIRRRAHEGLSPENLRGFANKPEKHAQLKKVLDFFPTLTVEGLLDDLREEPRRDRRWLMLSLLEAHGAPAREAALERLAPFLDDMSEDPHGYYTRNLVFLLRRIPAPQDRADDRERALLVRASEWGRPALVILEAVGALGQLKHPDAEAALLLRLQETEAALAENDTGDYDADELLRLLDRTASALARQGTERSVGALVDHALRRQPALGDTTARLEALSGQDLSAFPGTLDRIVATLKRELPTKVLGLVLSKNEQSLRHMIQALAHSPAPAVRELLDDVVRKYHDRDFSAQAAKVLDGFGTAERPVKEKPTAVSSLTGDVELFGLPNLLQSLSDSRVSGTLTLKDGDDATIGTLDLLEGKIAGCHVGRLHGEIAVYQLFECPAPGTFLFQRSQNGGPPVEGAAPMEVMPTILEGLRRHDELQQARALVPDDLKLKPTATKPTPLPDEEDVTFMREVWVKASSGVPASACETELSTDSYRVRRLYAHWVETGSLQAD